METLRKPFFIAAIVLMAIVVLLEIGSLGVLRGGAGQPDLASLLASDELRSAFDEAQSSGELGSLLAQDKPPGLAIPALALVDGLLLFTTALMGVSLLIKERLQGRLQGGATLIAALLIILLAIGAIVAALSAVILMVALLLAAPFGTLTYLAIYGFFNRGGAGAALGLLMLLKLGVAICLVLAQQRFLQNKGLVLLIITSFAGNVIVSFLHGLVPLFLASITDAIAAIVIGLIAAIWALVFLVGSLQSVVKALRVDRA